MRQTRRHLCLLMCLGTLLCSNAGCDILLQLLNGGEGPPPFELPLNTILVVIDNQSGLPVTVDAKFIAANADVRLTTRALKSAGVEAKASIIRTLAERIDVTAKVADDASAVLKVPVGYVLLEKTFLLNIDYEGGGTLNIIIPAIPGDCNNNGIADDQDITDGTSEDCNSNGLPDECEISVDSEAPGGPFYCEADCDADCNNNGVPDACDIVNGTSQDCNGNSVPDECDISSGDSQDCNENGVPDECELDSGASQDCNGNGIPDECDIQNEFSHDCNENGVPDECEISQDSEAPNGPFYCVEGCAADCNNNGIPDECDISGGASTDCNENGIPDDCEVQEPVILECAIGGDIEADSSCTGTVPDLTQSVQATDNCTEVADLVITQSPEAGTVLSTLNEQVTVTITVTDSDNRTAQCSAVVTLIDTTPPQIFGCPESWTVDADAQCQGTLPDFAGYISATDNCGDDSGGALQAPRGVAPSSDVTITQDPLPGTVLSVGAETIVELTATDGSGNQSVCEFSVTVEDNQRPTIVCPPTTSQPADPEDDETFVHVAQPTVDDNCGIESVVNNYNNTDDASDYYPKGITHVTWTVTDTSGNTRTCTHIVRVGSSGSLTGGDEPNSPSLPPLPEPIPIPLEPLPKPIPTGIPPLSLLNARPRPSLNPAYRHCDPKEAFFCPGSMV